jgi:hypothetical protein
MAEIKALFTADIHLLEKAFKEAAEKAKELGKQIGEVGNDLGKGVTGFDIGKALGIGGAVYAAGKLGDALIDAAKEGYKAFQQYQDAVLKFKYNLPSSAGTLEQRQKLGEETAEATESKVGQGGFNFQQLSNASLSLMEASKEFRESPEKLNSMIDTVIALAIKSGNSPEAITESYRKLVVSIKEEGGKAVGKFFKSTPGLEEQAEGVRDERQADYLRAQKLSSIEAGTTAQRAAYNKIGGTSTDEIMSQEASRLGTQGVLDKILDMMTKAAPKEITADYAKNHPEAALMASMEVVSKSFGEQMAPAISDLTKVITASMPDIKDACVELGKAMAGLIPIVSTLAATMESIFADMSEHLGIAKVNADAKEMSGRVDKVLSEGGGSQNLAPSTVGEYTAGLYFGPESEAEKAKGIKEGADKKKADAISTAAADDATKAANEVDKITAKTDADHAASVRQTAFEATQAMFESQARAAARVSGIDPSDRIRAEAAAKDRALNEESEVKIAKITSEIKARALTRTAEDAEDKTPAQKTSRDAVRLAQDAASANEIADLQAEAAQKIRAANQDAADKIIDAQEAAAKRIASTQEAGKDGQMSRAWEAIARAASAPIEGLALPPGAQSLVGQALGGTSSPSVPNLPPVGQTSTLADVVKSITETNNLLKLLGVSSDALVHVFS